MKDKGLGAHLLARRLCDSCKQVRAKGASTMSPNKLPTGHHPDHPANNHRPKATKGPQKVSRARKAPRIDSRAAKRFIGSTRVGSGSASASLTS